MAQIKTMHAGSLPRPADLYEMVLAKEAGKPYDEQAFEHHLRDAVAKVVRLQADVGLDSVNEGEFGKSNFNNYMRERLGGFEERATDGSVRVSISDRDKAGGSPTISPSAVERPSASSRAASTVSSPSPTLATRPLHAT